MSDSKKDYYRILGVGRNAPSEVIHAAYRTMMGKMRKHPDLGGDEEEAKLINEAYQVLRDPRSRSEYDAGSYSGSVDPASERRRARRRPSAAVVSFCFQHDQSWYSAKLKDISELGLRMRSHEPLSVGQEIVIAWANCACKAVTGIVRWSRMFHPTVFERVYEAGVEFEEEVSDIDSRVMV